MAPVAPGYSRPVISPIRLRTATALLALVALQPTRGASQASRDDGQWTMPGTDYAATRYTGLAEITAANAPRLRAVWTFSTGVLGGHDCQTFGAATTTNLVAPNPDVINASA